jgi:Zn finger protein HypA/HybF involved in hydrogenase expression
VNVHLSTPAAPKVAACGDTAATRFTFWRWKATCRTCKAATAAVAYEKAQQTESVYRTDLPIRYSALVRFSRERSMTEAALIEFERDKNIACSVCPACKADLSDPIALFDVKAHRMVFACPNCSEPKMRARWEREGLST